MFGLCRYFRHSLKFNYPIQLTDLAVDFLSILVMAEIVCPSCGKKVKGEHGLSLHTSCWCHKNESGFNDLLQQRREHSQTVAAEEQRRIRAEAENQAEIERLQREEDALQAQRLAEYQALSVCSYIKD
jgi:hypothetical protein